MHIKIQYIQSYFTNTGEHINEYKLYINEYKLYYLHFNNQLISIYITLSFFLQVMALHRREVRAGGLQAQDSDLKYKDPVKQMSEEQVMT